MMKKSGAIAALTVALLAMAVLVTQSCQVPEADSESKTGNVRLNFSYSGSGRTLMPDAPTFSRYVLEFTHGVDGALPAKTLVVGIDDIDPFDTISLVPGDYTLTVTGYEGAGTATPVAVATTAATPGGITVNPIGNRITGGFSIGSTQEITLTVELAPFTMGVTTHLGTFSWDIDLDNVSGVINTAIMQVRTYPALAFITGAEAVEMNDANDTERTGSFDMLPSGVYAVDFNIVTSNGNIQFRDLVHIYRNLTSPLVRGFSDDNLYAVTPGDVVGDITYIHATDATFDIAIASTPNQALNAGLTAGNPITLSRGANAAYPSTVVISLDNAGAGEFFASYGWFRDSTALTAGVGVGGALTVSLTNSPFNVLINDLEITLIGTRASGSPLYYSLPLHIKIIP
jgi:hypothetical protein